MDAASGETQRTGFKMEPKKKKVEKKGLGYARGSKSANPAQTERSNFDNQSVNVMWVSAGDLVPRGHLGISKYSLVGWWKTHLDPFPTVAEVRKWAKVVWRLKDSLTVMFLNKDLLFLEFVDLEDAQWVIEVGRRSFKGNPLQLERLNPDSGCKEERNGQGGVDACDRTSTPFMDWGDPKEDRGQLRGLYCH